MCPKRAKWWQGRSVRVSILPRSTRNIAYISRQIRPRMYPSFEPIIFRCPGCGCCISRQPPIALAVNVVHTRHDVVIVYIRSVAIHRDQCSYAYDWSWVRSIESLELHESPLPVRNFLVTLPLCAPNLRTNEGVTLYVLVPVLVWEIERPSDGL